MVYQVVTSINKEGLCRNLICKHMVNVLRWIAVLPTALVVSIIGYYVVIFGNMATNAWMGNGWSTFEDGWSLTNIIGFVVSNIFFGYGFVYGGVLVTPHYKKQTSIVLVAFLAALIGISFSLSLITGAWVEVLIATLITLVAAVVACVKTTDDGLELEN